jgi:hypothetical protein
VHGRRAAHDSRILQQANAMLGLPLQHTRERRVGHRREGMIAHAGFRQQLVADEQITFVDGPLVGRKCRIEYREVLTQRIQQCVGHRSDVAWSVESKVEQYLK